MRTFDDGRRTSSSKSQSLTSDKGKISVEEIVKRVRGFYRYENAHTAEAETKLGFTAVQPKLKVRGALLLTKATMFGDKNKLFPGCTFVVGTDTSARILDVKYYRQSVEILLQQLEDIGKSGTKFLV